MISVTVSPRLGVELGAPRLLEPLAHGRSASTDW